MEPVREQPQQQERPTTPLKCPRCGSLNNKFRYFNNRSLAQPRHYCKTCKRQWTVGGNLRDIPYGGKTRNGTRASSSRCQDTRSQTPQPPLTLGEQHLQNSLTLTTMGATVPQNFGTSMTQSTTKLPAAGSSLSSYYFINEFPCLDGERSLIQPNQRVYPGSQFDSASASKAIPQEWNIQTMPSQQAPPQLIPMHKESYQTHNKPNNSTPDIYRSSLVQPIWSMNSLSPGVMNNFSFSTSNASIWNNFGGNSSDTEMDTTSVNVDEWLNFSGDSL